MLLPKNKLEDIDYWVHATQKGYLYMADVVTIYWKKHGWFFQKKSTFKWERFVSYEDKSKGTIKYAMAPTCQELLKQLTEYTKELNANPS